MGNRCCITIPALHNDSHEGLAQVKKYVRKYTKAQRLSAIKRTQAWRKKQKGKR